MFKTNLGRAQATTAKGTAVVFTDDKARLLEESAQLDELNNGAIANALKLGRFQGSMKEMELVHGEFEGPTKQVLAVGLGKFKTLGRREWFLLGISLGKKLDQIGTREASVMLGDLNGKTSTPEAAIALIEGVHMGMYRFDRFKTEQKPHQQAKFRTLNILTLQRYIGDLRDQVELAEATLESVDMTREMVNLPPNIANPLYMVERAEELKELGIKVTVLDEKQLEKLGMNLMLAVGRASKVPPRLIVMEYNGAAKSDPKHAVIGKGVMFDTGGYNLKPSRAINTMKCDMGGAAVTMGLMKSLAKRGSKVNVVGVCGCVMNMIDGDGFLPDDVITGYKGLTVEIGNTDAEGRLVLADAIAYTIDKYKPKQVIDLATLTGAVMVAIGGQYAGMFSTNEATAKGLDAAGKETGERLWRLPIDDAYAAKTDIADLNNDGSPYGGASTAAVFLKKFADKTPWTHLDIAGVTFNEKIPSAVPVPGASGFGVRLLTEYFEKHAK